MVKIGDKLFLLIIVSALLSLSFVNAASPIGECTLAGNTDNLIMQLSAKTNAHGELPGGTYPVGICWDKKLGRPAQGACSLGNSLVLYLSTPFATSAIATNSHAEAPDVPNPLYVPKVCFGLSTKLDCRTTARNGLCSAIPGGGYSFINVSLSQNPLQMPQNAHLSLAYNDPNYPYRICCKEGTPTCGSITGQSCKSACDLGDTPGVGTCGSGVCCMAPGPATISDITWETLSGTSITSTNRSKTINLVVTGTNFIGKTVAFNVGKTKTLLDEVICLFADCPDYYNGIVTSQSNTRAVLSWQAGQNNDATLSEGKFKFGASVDTATGVSQELTVYPQDINIPPTVDIISPTNCAVYRTAQNVPLNISFTDPDDTLEFQWNFGDGTALSSWNSNGNTTHSYTSPGSKQLVVYARQIGDLSYSAADSLTILVIPTTANRPTTADQTYTCAVIDSPPWGSTQSNPVSFSAEGSTGLKQTKTGTADELVCTAGPCPPQTADGVTPIPRVIGGGVYSAVTFQWLSGIVSGSTYSYDASPIAQGLGVVSATKNYASFGRKVINLSMSMSPPTFFVSEFVSQGSVNPLNPVCIDQGTKWSIPIAGGGYSVEPTTSDFDCHRDDGVNELGDPQTDCCPSGYSCDFPETNRCVPSERTLCDHFETELECTGEANNLGIGSFEINGILPPIEGQPFCSYSQELPGNPGCFNRTFCQCTWNSGSCQANGGFNLTGSCSGITIPDGSCFWDIDSEGECVGGIKFINWTASWLPATTTPADYCQNDRKEVQCLSEALLGPESNAIIISAIIALAIIFLYYFLKHLKKKNKKKK